MLSIKPKIAPTNILEDVLPPTTMTVILTAIVKTLL